MQVIISVKKVINIWPFLYIVFATHSSRIIFKNFPYSGINCDTSYSTRNKLFFLCLPRCSLCHLIFLPSICIVIRIPMRASPSPSPYRISSFTKLQMQQHHIGNSFAPCSRISIPQTRNGKVSSFLNPLGASVETGRSADGLFQRLVIAPTASFFPSRNEAWMTTRLCLIIKQTINKFPRHGSNGTTWPWPGMRGELQFERKMWISGSVFSLRWVMNYGRRNQPRGKNTKKEEAECFGRNWKVITLSFSFIFALVVFRNRTNDSKRSWKECWLVPMTMSGARGGKSFLGVLWFF